MPTERDIARDAATEIRDLHRFLVGWLGGQLPRTAEAFSRFSDVFDPDFAIFAPNGIVVRRDDLVRNLESAHGGYADNDPAFVIRIENIETRRIWKDHALMGYEEWQDLPGGTTARQSSVVLTTAPGAPHALRWLHLHETWIEGHAPPD